MGIYQPLGVGHDMDNWSEAPAIGLSYANVAMITRQIVQCNDNILFGRVKCVEFDLYTYNRDIILALNWHSDAFCNIPLFQSNIDFIYNVLNKIDNNRTCRYTNRYSK